MTEDIAADQHQNGPDADLSGQSNARSGSGSHGDTANSFPQDGPRKPKACPAALDRLQVVLGYQFKNPAVLDRAVIHASASDARLDSNERLEFLGDALLGAVVCEQIFDLYPRALEGEMTKIKSSAVSRHTCAVIARRMGLQDFLVLGKGMQTQERLPGSLAAAALEAVVAAIYIDGGYEAARSFIRPLFEPLIEKVAASGHQSNFKSVLQQHAQQLFDATPRYVILDEKGPDHAKAFNIRVELGDRCFEASWGSSKKQAEQQAALKALRELRLIDNNEQGEPVLTDAAEHSGDVGC